MTSNDNAKDDSKAADVTTTATVESANLTTLVKNK